MDRLTYGRLDDEADVVDMRLALKEAREQPWLWRLPGVELRRFEMIWLNNDSPIRDAYARALALDREARRAEQG